LKNQKAFYELKISTIQNKFEEKIRQLNKKIDQISTVENTLSVEHYKNLELSEEIKLLHQKSIEV
jgi:ribosome-associated translation inhibitor RaiA